MEKLSYDDPKRPKILALDLDGTVLNYRGHMGRDQFGEPIRGMIEELQQLRDRGVKIVIWTCRPDTQELRDHLTKNEIPFDYVNDHPWNGPDDPRKIHADWYLDDKSPVVFDGIATGLADRILAFKPWWQDVPWS